MMLPMNREINYHGTNEMILIHNAGVTMQILYVQEGSSRMKGLIIPDYFLNTLVLIVQMPFLYKSI